MNCRCHFFNKTVAFAGLIILLLSANLGALDLGALNFWIDLESGAAFTAYNDVQIPSDEGTRFSLSDDLSADPVWFFRVEGGAEYRRHGIRLLYAPLRVKSSGSLDTAVSYLDASFPANTPLEGVYQFNSYRLTYRYTLIDGPKLHLALGITGKIRDAYIELTDGTTTERRENFGFVPLINLDVRYRFTDAFALTLTGDGLAVPQGRAEDFLLALLYNPAPDLELRLGYRILEGGSDGGGKVYTFSMFHYATAGVRYRL